MNPKLKLGITMMTASALMLSTATSFAGTTTTTQTIPENVLEQMLAKGLITEAQMEAYLEKVEAANLATLKSELQVLVTAGTLTQTKADVAYTAIVADLEIAKTEREKMAAMTETELSTYLETLTDSTVTSNLDALKTAGTITTAQYTAVQKILMPTTTKATSENTKTGKTNIKTTTSTTTGTKTTATAGKKVKPAGVKTTNTTTTASTAATTTQATMLTTVKTKLAAMVTKGTLAQVQADAAYTAIIADQAALTADVDNIGDMTIEELVTYLSAQKTGSKTSALDALKTSGVLTSTQYNAIKAILASSQVPEEEMNQTNFGEVDIEQPPMPIPPMGQGQKKQGK